MIAEDPLADGLQRPQRAAKSNFLAIMGNFSIQYNFTSATIAVMVLSTTKYLGHPLYAEPAWSESLTLAVVFVGAMLGMVCMGRLGDLLGRSKAMRITTLMAICGAIIPALAAGPPDLVYGIVCVGRLVLGIGVGGIYPLSAVHAAEGSANAQSRGNRVSWGFFWQTPGMFAPYLIALLMFGTIVPDSPANWVPQFEFRALFAFGAVPALINFLATFREEESADFRNAVAQAPKRGVLETLRLEPRQTHTTLLGTAGTWFCYDVAFYGTNVFQPLILDKICLSGSRVADKCNQSLVQTMWQSLIVGLMAFPGCILAILLIQRMGSKRLNVYGMKLLSINFLAMGLVYQFSSESTTILFVLFCSLMFLLNFGPNLGTFVLPAVCFPAHIRSTCHGLSAFGGKLGAVAGALLFPAINDSRFGLPAVLYIQAVICLIGALASQLFLRHDWDYLQDEDKAATESFLHGESACSPLPETTCES